MMNKTIRQSIQRLKKGNDNFVNDKLTNLRQISSDRKALIEKQNPFAVILTCSDSRVIPELIFDTGLGDLFVVRVAGNVANTSSIASIEYAVAHLNVNLIVVLGHQNCGAITSAIAGGNFGKNLHHLLMHLNPAIANTNDNAVDDIAIINTKLTAVKLNDDSMIINAAVSSKKIEIIPAFYSLETGKVNFIE